MSYTPHPCLDCKVLTTWGYRCRNCSRRREKARNASQKRKAYRDPVYRSQPATGLCWLCEKPIEPGTGTRDHLVPLVFNDDSSNTVTLPAIEAATAREVRELDDVMSVREQLSHIRDDIRELERIMRVHENRWQRIIGVMLVLTFLGVGSLLSILFMLWSLFQALT